MAVQLDRVEEAIAAIAAGALVIVVDDADREHEGDLIMAPAKALPEQVAFMIRHTSGILCTPLPLAEARRLRLDPMVARNDVPLGTAFTVAVRLSHRTHHRHFRRGTQPDRAGAGERQCGRRGLRAGPHLPFDRP